MKIFHSNKKSEFEKVTILRDVVGFQVDFFFLNTTNTICHFFATKKVTKNVLREISSFPLELLLDDQRVPLWKPYCFTYAKGGFL